MFAWLMEILTHMFYFTGYIRSQSFARPLSREDEERCLAALQKGDAYARDQLIEHNLRLVAHIVKSMTSAGPRPMI
ncbi:MAG: sporulation sigma factor SigK [Merdibacter sp.]